MITEIEGPKMSIEEVREYFEQFINSRDEINEVMPKLLKDADLLKNSMQNQVVDDLTRNIGIIKQYHEYAEEIIEKHPENEPYTDEEMREVVEYITTAKEFLFSIMQTIMIYQMQP